MVHRLHRTRGSLFNGGVAEWSNALVLKTSRPKGLVGSNPTPSAIAQNEPALNQCNPSAHWQA